MTRTHEELRPGDVVLIRARVSNDGRVAVNRNGSNLTSPVLLDIVSVEPRSFQEGDRVIAMGRHHGTVVKVWPDGTLLWLQLDESGESGSSKCKGWTVNVADCRREPPAPPSAEVLPFKEAAE